METPITVDTPADTMIRHAAERGLVRLGDGAVVRLVRWRGNRVAGNKAGSSVTNARVIRQHLGAAPFSVKLSQVAAIIYIVPASDILTSRPESGKM